MIVGIGTDLISIQRIQCVQKKSEDRFIHRILTEKERQIYHKRHQSSAYLASRFAAKEAIAKAFKVGIGRISFQDIEIDNNEQGAPIVILHGYAEELRKIKKIKTIHISLSDEKCYAIAFIILISCSE
ncbi:MAG: holo-ACP synthase [Endozoicomonadaceae bacterium]|nr:holo-ACP synthase [Endozoicomonadaceae bacterium]